MTTSNDDCSAAGHQSGGGSFPVFPPVAPAPAAPANRQLVPPSTNL
ncbi:MAG: hypothetical protein NTX51_05185 [Verrucomicrobia bacterium]|nr:hypothetical protein [Verrucomicrobiota bacterium]